VGALPPTTHTPEKLSYDKRSKIAQVRRRRAAAAAESDLGAPLPVGDFTLELERTSMNAALAPLRELPGFSPVRTRADLDRFALTPAGMLTGH
jgi:hypothetical protein